MARGVAAHLELGKETDRVCERPGMKSPTTQQQGESLKPRVIRLVKCVQAADNEQRGHRQANHDGNATSRRRAVCAQRVLKVLVRINASLAHCGAARTRARQRALTEESEGRSKRQNKFEPFHLRTWAFVTGQAQRIAKAAA
eukprot:5105464-Prymnesium_polylepis.1